MKAHLRFDIRSEDTDRFSLEWKGQTLIRFIDGGQTALLEATDFAPMDLLRWGAPLALAPLGKVVLHAAAVGLDDRVFAFCGIGGAGKSTLAQALARRGTRLVSDDLVILDRGIRVELGAEAKLRRWCSEKSSASSAGPIHFVELFETLTTEPIGDELALEGLFFVDENRTGDSSAAIDPLDPTETFQRLVTHGFGGLKIPKAWKHQFEAYAAISANVRAAALRMPSGIDRMEDALGPFMEVLRSW